MRFIYSALFTIGLLVSVPLVLPEKFSELALSAAWAQTVETSEAEAEQLLKKGLEQLEDKQYQEAFQTFQATYEVCQRLQERECETVASYGMGVALLGMGTIAIDAAQYSEALDFAQQGLALVRESDVQRMFPDESRLGEGAALQVIGEIFLSRGEYSRALEEFQQALIIAREIDDRSGEGKALNNMGVAYRSLGQYSQALEHYQQALSIRREIGDRNGEGLTLSNIGVVYDFLGQYSQALEHHQQALTIAREIGDRDRESTGLNNIGSVYYSLGQYSQALEHYQQALTIAREIRDRRKEGTILSGIGLVYHSLGQYSQALEQYQQALTIAREIGDRDGESTRLIGIGSVYHSLGQYSQALEQYQQALTIAREIGNRRGEGVALNNIGSVYQYLDQYQQALEQYQQALIIRREIGDRSGEGATLNNIGSVLRSLGRYPDALEQYQQALVIFRELGERDRVGTLLSNIGLVLEAQNQAELAIVFFKQSVNTYEMIRGDIRSLSLEQQQAYTETVAGTYRKLADLLLSQQRILEAQQVLDLLKLEELREYSRNARSFESTESIALNAVEAAILENHETLIAFGQKLLECEQTNCTERETLFNQRRDLVAAYHQQVDQFVSTIRANRGNDAFFVDPQTFNEDMREIVAQPGTVLIYPFVQDNKLWLIWTAAGDIVGSRAIDVSQQKLGETVVQFRDLLESPDSDIRELQAVGKQLYDWLIQPIEAELSTQLPNGQTINHLIFAQDRVLRYLPMAALYDGEQYLIQRYKLSTILSAELTDMTDRLAPGTNGNSMLALGLSNPVNGLDALPHVETELAEIVRLSSNDATGIYPGLEFLNEQFNLRALELNLRNSRILHIATHGKFVPGLPDESYLVLGDGNRLTIDQINRLGSDLRDVKLVVLSACETALGGPTADGLEVAGISSYFLDSKRASNVIASLWMVNDASTSQLMQQFYGHLAQGNAVAPVTTTDALRTAQLSLLTGEAVAIDSDSRSDIVPAPDGRVVIERAAGATSRAYSHPYYWAPFILIGNGL